MTSHPIYLSYKEEHIKYLCTVLHTLQGMARSLVLALAAVVLLGVTCTAQQDADWWKYVTYYQVYPRSFKDSNGDGIGDLKGITEKIPHMVEAGVDCVWLSPIYKSPMKDFGYDIADFRSIDPIFGTWEDFEELAQALRDNGLRLLMDLVPNHSSDQHEWFQKSIAREDPYTDYYVWKPSKGVNENGTQIPPNNWISAFAGSAWEWNEQRQEFYLHQFALGQPDLNYRNPLVVKEMQDVFRFWLDNGVDGFRIDAPAHIWEHEDFLDEPPSNDPNCPPDQFCQLRHIYVMDQEEVFDVLYAFRQVVDQYEEETGEIKVLMSEASPDLGRTMRYYGNDSISIIHFPFNFYLIWEINNMTDAYGVENATMRWLDAMPMGRTANWVLGNHDNFRIATRVGPEFAMVNQMFAFLLPGAIISFMGEDINMENTFVSWEDTQDPQGCNAGPEYYQRFSRDPQRTPFQWNDQPFAGFTEGNKTWLPVNENYPVVNLQAQRVASKSPFKIYQALTAARKTPAIQHGSFDLRVLSKEVIAFTRELANEESFMMITNTAYYPVEADVSFFLNIPVEATVYAASVDSAVQAGDIVSIFFVPLPARGGVILKYIPN